MDRFDFVVASVHSRFHMDAREQTERIVRPMDRAMNNVRQKELAAIDPDAEAA